jgi:virginiamycin B lyase
MRRNPIFLLPVLALAALLADAAPASAAPNDVRTWSNAGLVQPEGLAQTPDGRLWTVDLADQALVRFDPATGGFQRHTWFEGTKPGTGLILGPDDLLWWGTDSGLGSYDPATDTKAGVIIADVDDATGLVVGPDGAVWFASQGSDRIGRHASGGIVSTYPNANIDQPNDLAVGADGAIWFTSTLNDRIGRIDASTFAITTYTDPEGEVDAPRSIVAGPDGRLWFTSTGSDRIGRIDPTTHDIVTFTSPQVDNPQGIAVGPDGHLWFGNANGRLGRANRYTGAITTFPDVDGEVGAVNAVLDGPGDHLWFTSTGVPTIGRIALPRCAGRVVTSRLALGEGASTGNDVILGTAQADTVVALGGNDRVCGGRGNDQLFGNLGADVLEGGAGNDRLVGGAQGDILRGGAGRDRLVGGAQHDRCAGGPQPDTSQTCEVKTSIP